MKQKEQGQTSYQQRMKRNERNKEPDRAALRSCQNVLFNEKQSAVYGVVLFVQCVHSARRKWLVRV